MFRIVSDSSCDLCFDAGSVQAEAFRKVPLTIITPEKNYVDDVTLDSAAMMQELSGGTGKTSTACPAPGLWLEAFDGASEIFVLTITSKLSGSFNSARLAVDMYQQDHPGCKIHLMDTFSCGSEISLLVMRLMELNAKGASFEAARVDIELYRRRTQLTFMLSSLDNLIRNGRVSKVAGAAAKLLGINIIGRASEEGEFQVLQKVRASARIYRQMLDEMIAHGYHGGKVILAHCANAAGADKLRELIRARFSGAQVTIMPTGGLCSFYAELGGLMVGYET